MTLHIPQELLLQIWDYGERTYPEENAGLILGAINGDERWASRLLPLENQSQSESRHNRYLINPEDMMAGEQEAESLDLEILGVFHSHPDHPAEPSEFDLQWALPWFSYLITSVDRGQALDSRSWRLNDDRSQMIEEVLHVQLDLDTTNRRFKLKTQKEKNR
ncbi:MAG TPA: M67 family metallopeptidase [Anaerolineae bacterium]|nr:M67 family metallopeptidase [Anaerolineae bacterium]